MALLVGYVERNTDHSHEADDVRQTDHQAPIRLLDRLLHAPAPLRGLKSSFVSILARARVLNADPRKVAVLRSFEGWPQAHFKRTSTLMPVLAFAVQAVRHASTLLESVAVIHGILQRRERPAVIDTTLQVLVVDRVRVSEAIAAIVGWKELLLNSRLVDRGELVLVDKVIQVIQSLGILLNVLMILAHRSQLTCLIHVISPLDGSNPGPPLTSYSPTPRFIASWSPYAVLEIPPHSVIMLHRFSASASVSNARQSSTHPLSSTDSKGPS
eukprot:CAMPEP_0177710254 /NCGR_PEP_ID=MMETSP0484_2-20121128/11237_1 /TAXON_ID=354590 /ORGANISM="Rhodomonas lens, Strain RHODO" /LENGTH=269 /DNA_ID=CAMNT_0019221923 /DNA_START=312 /DNA_END=1122 /DNA_ORIENTATION=-